MGLLSLLGMGGTGAARLLAGGGRPGVYGRCTWWRRSAVSAVSRMMTIPGWGRSTTVLLLSLLLSG